MRVLRVVLLSRTAIEDHARSGHYTYWLLEMRTFKRGSGSMTSLQLRLGDTGREADCQENYIRAANRRMLRKPDWAQLHGDSVTGSLARSRAPMRRPKGSSGEVLRDKRYLL